MGRRGECYGRLTLKGMLTGFRRLTGEQVNARRLLKSWTLHFAAKHIDEVPIPFE